MDTITVKDGTQIFYKDWGPGQPLFFITAGRSLRTTGMGEMMFFLSADTASSLMIAADTAALPRR
jgi:non-heme chloroperoxidase